MSPDRPDRMQDPALAEFERHRREYINAMKRIRLENPDIDMVELEMRASEEVMAKGPKSRAYYRLQATRQLQGKKSMEKDMKKRLAEEAAKRKGEEAAEEKEAEDKKIDDGVCREAVQ